MNKNYGFFLVLSLFCSAGLSFAADIQKNRYEAIVQAFSAETGSFNEGFIPSDGDIVVIAEHKNSLQNHLAQTKKIYAESYKPMLLYAGSVLALFRAGQLGFSSDTIISVNEFTTDPEIKEGQTRKNAQKSIITNATQRAWNLVDGFFLPLGLLAFARFLFEKAGSYKAELMMLQDDISCHDSIIRALEAL